MVNFSFAGIETWESLPFILDFIDDVFDVFIVNLSLVYVLFQLPVGTHVVGTHVVG